jgi:hypothetical protein
MLGSRRWPLVVIALWGAAGAARAADAVDVVAGVRLSSPECPIAPLSVPELVEALRPELAGRAAAAEPTLVTLAIEPCDVGTTSVRVTVGASSREIGLGDVAPSARPRALALAIAELVRGAAPPPPPPPPEPLAPVAPPPAVPPPPRVEVGAEALATLFPARHTTLWGGRALAGWASEIAHAELFLEAAAGSRDVAGGAIDVRRLGGGVFFGTSRPFGGGRAVARSAFGASLDWTHVAGRAATPDVSTGAGSGLTLALRLRLSLAFPVSSSVSLHAFAEPGFVLRGLDATADGARAAGVWGPLVAFGLGGAYGR